MSAVVDVPFEAAPAHVRGWIEVSGIGAAVVLRISGELCTESRGAIEPAVMAALASATAVILDLDELTFCDSHGMAMFVAAGEKAKLEGTRLTVRNLRRPVRRMFEIAGLDGQIQLIE